MMDALVAFLYKLFEDNEVIVLATYGQAFFVLGLSVALQWRSESRLELARSVPLLAAFGLIQATVIWGDLVIPSNAQIIQDSDVSLLRLIQLLLMLVGYTCLLHFGLRLNWHNDSMVRIPWLLAAIVGALIFGFATTGADLALVRLRFEQIVGPLFIFTGALAGAWGMRQTATQVEAMGLPDHIVTWLRVAGLSLGAYGVVGGLFIPLTVEQLRVIDFNFLGLPFAIPRLLAVAALAWAMIRALTIFRLELQRTREEIGRFRALATDRQRIGRELHDGTIQAIYGAGLLLENAVSLIPDDPRSAQELGRTTMTMLNKTIQDIRHYIHELSDGEGQLAETIGRLVEELQQHCGCMIDYRLSGTIPKYPSDLQNHLVRIAREALTNAIRHAEATQITLTLSGEPDALVLTVADDGTGLPTGNAFRAGGQGVPNLRARASLLNGTLRVVNRVGGGVLVELVVPHHLPARVATGNGYLEMAESHQE